MKRLTERGANERRKDALLLLLGQGLGERREDVGERVLEAVLELRADAFDALEIILARDLAEERLR